VTRKAHDLDREATEARRFRDDRSYVTHSGHEFLFGDDVRARRQEVYERDEGKCQGCRKYIGWTWGHMHHRQGGLVGRCTCLHNVEWRCIDCHAKEHVRVMWGKYPDA